MQTPVSVDSSPAVQNSQSAIEIVDRQVRIEFRSVIRLHRFDNPLTLIREWRDIPGALLEISGGITNREFEPILIGGRVLSGIKAGSYINHSIQCGPELINCFAQFEAE